MVVKASYTVVVRVVKASNTVVVKASYTNSAMDPTSEASRY